MRWHKEIYSRFFNLLTFLSSITEEMNCCEFNQSFSTLFARTHSKTIRFHQPGTQARVSGPDLQTVVEKKRYYQKQEECDEIINVSIRCAFPINENRGRRCMREIETKHNIYHLVSFPSPHLKFFSFNNRMKSYW